MELFTILLAIFIVGFFGTAVLVEFITLILKRKKENKKWNH